MSVMGVLQEPERVETAGRRDDVGGLKGPESRLAVTGVPAL